MAFNLSDAMQGYFSPDRISRVAASLGERKANAMSQRPSSGSGGGQQGKEMLGICAAFGRPRHPACLPAIKVKLPDGTKLDAYKGGIEDRLAAFLNSTDPADSISA